MSYWIEIRCHSQTSNDCYSGRQIKTPMEKTAGATLKAINQTLLRLGKEARLYGWTVDNHGWICPECRRGK